MPAGLEESIMLLCDIGNTSFHFYDTETGREMKKAAETFDPAEITQRICYINVNAEVQPKLDALGNWTDLQPFVERQKYYATMGIDRIMACEAIDEGVVVDAGSAITVDIVRDGVFEGGFIYPGVTALQSLYPAISSKLDYSFNFGVQLDKMPKNTPDAISYGALGLLAREVAGYALPVYLTGGDAQTLRPLFSEAAVAKYLLFSGMQKIIEKAQLC